MFGTEALQVIIVKLSNVSIRASLVKDLLLGVGVISAPLYYWHAS